MCLQRERADQGRESTDALSGRGLSSPMSRPPVGGAGGLAHAVLLRALGLSPVLVTTQSQPSGPVQVSAWLRHHVQATGRVARVVGTWCPGRGAWK